MTTVAVVSILAAIAIPAYQDYVVRSQVSEGAMLSEGSKVAVAEYYSNKGSMPTDNATAGVAQPSSIEGNYVSSVTIDNGRINVVYGNRANAAIRGGVLSFVPDPQAGMVRWSCDTAAGTTIPVKYRPGACR
ncbi:MAG: pilin [Proteobacteria bacterium]|nr:pilin [Pseudomonadota bacterium]